jgi:hypothetical protein
LFQNGAGLLVSRGFIILENSDEKPLMNANQGIQNKPTLQTGHTIGDGKLSGRNLSSCMDKRRLAKISG